MRQSRRMLSNAAAVGLSQMLLLVPSLILVPFLISGIGDEGYGIYVLIWSLFMAIIQLQNSLQSGVVKYSAGFLSQGQLQKVNSVVSSSFLYSIVIAVLACSIILAVRVAYKPAEGGQTVLIVVALLTLLTIPFTPYVGVIQAKQRYDVNALATSVTRFAGLGLIFLWFQLIGPSVEAVIIIMVGSFLASQLVQAPIAYRLIPGLLNSPRLSEWASFRLVFSFGTMTVIASLCLAANSTGVRWLMASMVSTTFVSHLAIMLMPGFVLMRIFGSVTNIVMPAASAYDAAGNFQMLGELLIRGMRYMTLIMIPATVAAGLLMENVLVLWVGPDYAFLAPYAVAIFVGRAVLECTSVAHHILKGIGNLQVVVVSYAAGLIAVPSLLIWQINAYTSDPYFAVTVGLLTGYLVCAMWQLLACTYAIHANLWRVILRAYLRPASVGIPATAAAISLSLAMAPDTFLPHLVVASIAVMLFALLAYYFALSELERKEVRQAKSFAMAALASLIERRST